MNPLTIIKDPEKVYTKEELQANSPIPLFEDFYIGEDPNNIESFNNIQQNRNDDNFHPIEGKYSSLLPEYLQVFASKLLIGPNDEIRMDIPLTQEFIDAMCLKYSLASPPSRNDMVKILQNDVDDFFKKFNAAKALRAIEY